MQRRKYGLALLASVSAVIAAVGGAAIAQEDRYPDSIPCKHSSMATQARALFRAQLASAGTSTAALQVPAYQLSPLAHDCQKLSRNKRWAFDKYYGLTGLYAAAPPTESSFADGWKQVAAIYKYDAEDYDPLGLPAEFKDYCVELTDSAGDWKARLTTMRGGASCDTVTVTMLKVHRQKYTGPAVARFHWEGNRRNSIGVKCGNMWCRVGKDLEDGDIALPEQPSSIVGVMDRQRLHPVDKVSSSKHSKAVAAIMPHEGLDTLRELEQFRGWQHVATVWIDDETDGYDEKFGYGKGKNEIHVMRMGSGPPRETEDWRARIVSSDTTVYKRVIWRNMRAEHTESEPAVSGDVWPPPIARWAWVHDDERGWVRCAYGCCEITEMDLDE